MRNLLIIISILVFSCSLPATAKDTAHKGKKAAVTSKTAAPAGKQNIVIIPLVNIPANLTPLANALESALVEGLNQRYVVFSGPQVEEQAKKAFAHENTHAVGECDETRCIENIALFFQAELIGFISIKELQGDYYITFDIKNIFDNKAVYSKASTCEKCKPPQVLEALKQMTGGAVQPAAPVQAAPAAPVQSAQAVQPAPEPVKAQDTESLQWAEVQKGNSIEDYEAYLSQYPKGKFAVLAHGKIKKLKEQQAKETRRQQAQAAAERQQQDQQAWNEASTTGSEAAYQSYLDAYPKGSFANLASARLAKLKKDHATEEAKRRKEEALAARTADHTTSGIEMVRIPGRNYEIGKTEVTQKQWRDVMGANPSEFQNCGDSCPVENVSWNDIQEFLQKLNAKTGKQYRLPTEEEWEYACYGGNQTEYCGGNDINAVAWYDNNSNNATHPVGQKQTNGYGLYDMSGNVWEWVQDKWDYEHDWRVRRGGSWIDRSRMNGEQYVPPTRLFSMPTNQGASLGFRLARTLP